MANAVEEVVEEDAPQPGEQFLFRLSLEAFEVLLGLEERFLDEIGRSNLALNVRLEMLMSDEQQIRPARFQQAPQRFRRAVACFLERLFYLPRRRCAVVGRGRHLHPPPRLGRTSPYGHLSSGVASAPRELS